MATHVICMLVPAKSRDVRGSDFLGDDQNHSDIITDKVHALQEQHAHASTERMPAFHVRYQEKVVTIFPLGISLSMN